MEVPAPRVIAYTRVSTQGQVPNSSLATQRFVIEQYAQNHQLIVDEVIREVGSAYRTIPDHMRELARTLPNGSRILVALTDRFSRNIEYGRLLLDLFQGKGITVTETMRNQHSNTVPGRAHFDRQIQSAQDESENKSLRAQMLTIYRATDEYQDFQEGGSDYELSESEEDAGDDGEYVPGE
jgi:DNA invertase Pin-like site-specific DNA recombinase